MPSDVVMTVTAIFLVFALFAAALTWADIQTRKYRG